MYSTFFPGVIFCQAEDGIRDADVTGVQTCALPISRARLVQFAASGCSRKSCSIDGTKWIVVTPSRRIVSARYDGSLWPPGRAMTSRAPASIGQKNSHTDTSKLNGVFCRTVSCGCSAYASCIHARRFTTARCSFIAPFGTPVEPEV